MVDTVRLSADARLAAELAANIAVDFTQQQAETFKEILKAVRSLDRSMQNPPRQYSFVHRIGLPNPQGIDGIGSWREMTQNGVIVRMAQLYYSANAPADTVVTIRGLLSGQELQFQREALVNRIVVGEYIYLPSVVTMTISSTATVVAGTAPTVLLSLLTVPLESGRW